VSFMVTATKTRPLRGLLLPMPARRRRHLTSFPNIGRSALAARSTILVVVVLLLVCPIRAATGPDPSHLKAEARQAFERYTALTDARNQIELQRGTDLLWIDALPEKERADAYAALKAGQVKIRKLQTRDNGQAAPCPGCLIHHWIAAIFIPGANLDDVLRILQDYDHQSTYYAPDVERSKLLSHDGDHFRAFLRFRRHKIVTAVLNTEHDVHYFRDTATRAHSRSSATRIAEVEDAGKTDERERAPGEDSGFLWGMETWWRIDQRDGGVYVQSEVASLTRDIPTGLGWLIGPFVTAIPKETLTFTLEATRKAVQSKLSHH